MVNTSWIVPWLVVGSCVVLVCLVNAACEIRAPRFLSAHQRAQLCANTALYGERPAECANAMKFSIHSSRNAALTLDICKDADGTGPAECFNRLPPNLKRDTKVALCAKASNSDPAHCAGEMSTLHGSNQLDEELLVSFCQNFAGNASAVLDCFLQLPAKLRLGQKLIVCRGASSVSPAECVNAVFKLNMRTESAIQMCSRAEGEGTVECYKQLGRDYKDPEKAKICYKAPSKETAKCVQEIKNSKISLENKVDVCKYSTTTAPGECVNGLSSHFTPEEKVEMCRGSRSMAPVICSDNMKGSNPDKQSRLQLCKGITSLGPLDCFNKAKYDFSVKQKVALCRQATSEAPNQCVSRLNLVSSFTNDNMVDLCQGANNVAPADCFNDIPFGISHYYGIQLCRNAQTNMPAVCAKNAPTRFNESEIVILCKGSLDTAPAACAKRVVSWLSNHEMAILCAEASSTAPASCAQSTPTWLTPMQKATLCHKATSDIPAVCASRIPRNVPAAYILRLCQGTTSLTAAHCARDVYYSKEDFNDNVIMSCRSASSIPTSLQITKFQYQCPVLTPNCQFSLLVQVYDQFEQEIKDDSNPIYVKITTISSTQDIELIRGLNTKLSVNGSVYYDNLFFREFGNFTVYLKSPGIITSVIRAHVSENATERNVVERCSNVFSQLQCKDLGAEEIDLSKQYMLLAPEHYLSALSCRDRLESSGIVIEGMLDKNFLISIHKLSYKLLTGHGLPTEGMSFWERLGLDSDVDEPTLKRIYRKFALEWHPDRWSGFPPSFKGKAKKIFTLISDAYTGLSGEKQTMKNRHSR